MTLAATPGGFIVFFVLALVVVVGIGYVSYLQAKARRQELRRFARKWGLRYVSEDRAFPKRYEAGFKALSEGSNRYATNLMRGEFEGRDLAVFDHHYTTGSGDNQTSHERTMLLVRLDLDLNRIHVRPEHLGDRVAAAFGADDIDFESAEFSDRYHVTAENKKLAYDFFHPEMIEYVLAMRAISFATYGKHLLAWRDNRKLTPREIRDLIEDTVGVLERIPRFLLKDRSTD